MAKSSDSKHIYYNASLTNPYFTSATSGITSQPIPISFSTNFNQPLLKKSDDYSMSIIKFNLPGQLIPIFIFPDPSKPLIFPPFKVSINYNDNFFTTTVIYISSTFLSPSDPTYYYVYSYQLFIEMINYAIQTSYRSMVIANPGFAGNYAPYLIYDPSTELISICYETSIWATINETGGSAALYFNTALYNFFQSFSTNFFYSGLSLSPAINDSWYVFNVYSNGGNSISSLSPPGYLYYSARPPNIAGVQMFQEYPCLYAWNQAIGVVITSSLLPIKYEYYPANQSTSIGAPNFRPVISDYNLTTSNGPDIRTRIVYNPTAEYRWVDLISTNPLSQLDFQIYWVDTFLNFTPVYLSPGQNFTMKFLFQSKYKDNDDESK